MIVSLPHGIPEAELDALREAVEATGVRTRAERSPEATLLVCLGEDTLLGTLRALPWPDGAVFVPAPSQYKLAARAPGRTGRLDVSGPSPLELGGPELAVVAGPCSVESLASLHETATAVARSGAVMLRGGAFKPRTSPYAFSGLGERALEMLGQVRAKTGLATVSEILDPRQVDAMLPHVDVFQVGARNMQNYALLAELGRIGRPVLLKRGLAATVEELLMAAEHVMARGNGSVILCERGVRAHETFTRNTLDVAAVAVLKRETHLPVFVDPSHAAGRSDLVAALSLAAVAAGCDGLLIEVHRDPQTALSDGAQSLTPQQFDQLMGQVAAVARAVGRRIMRPHVRSEAAA
jgi:3-deoxy-7-phosphoheptulonate synthase